MKDYISKLIDRNLQRRRESGITTYALYSVLILIVYQIIQRYPEIPIKSQFPDVISVITYAANLSFCIFGICFINSSETGSVNLSATRVIGKSGGTTTGFFEMFTMFSCFVFPLVGNVYCLVRTASNAEYAYVYFSVFSVLYALLCLIGVVAEYEEKKKKTKIEVLEGTGKTGSDWEAISITFYVIFMLGIISTLNITFIAVVPFPKLPVLIFGVLLYSIPCIICVIFELRRKDLFSKALENLEYEIHVRNLDDDEIRKKLQTSYLGFLLTEWVALNKKELEAFEADLSLDLEKIDETIINLDAIDKDTYPMEYQGRLNIINSMKSRAAIHSDRYFRGKLIEIDQIWQDRKLIVEERSLLATFQMSVLKSQKNTYKLLGKYKPSDEPID